MATVAAAMMDLGQDMDLWMNCARWLRDVGVLNNLHRIFQHGASIFDLAQTLRDGVVLCNALNAIDPTAINNARDFNTWFRPARLLCCYGHKERDCFQR